MLASRCIPHVNAVRSASHLLLVLACMHSCTFHSKLMHLQCNRSALASTPGGALHASQTAKPFGICLPKHHSWYLSAMFHLADTMKTCTTSLLLFPLDSSSHSLHLSLSYSLPSSIEFILLFSSPSSYFFPPLQQQHVASLLLFSCCSTAK